VDKQELDKWKDARPLLFAPTLLISAYLSYMPGFGFWFMGAKNLNDFAAVGVPATALLIVIFAIWWSPGPALLLVAGTVLFFYVTMHRFGNTYGSLREMNLNPGLLISITLLMIIIAAGDVVTGQWKR
jgi:hypothetical protein